MCECRCLEVLAGPARSCCSSPDCFNLPQVLYCCRESPHLWDVELQDICTGLTCLKATGALSFTGLEPKNDEIDTPLFCLYAVLILLGSTVLTPLFFVVSLTLVAHAKERSL